MNVMTARPSERLALLATVDPKTVTTAQTSDWLPMGKHEAAIFIAALGDIAAGAVDFKLEQAQDSSGTGAKDLVTATQLAASATLNDNKQIILEARAEDLDVANGFDFVRGSLTIGSTGGPACVIGLGAGNRYAPGSDDNLSTVVEIKAP